MTSIGSLTGQSAALREILDWLDSETTSALILEGPPGCGKTWVTTQLFTVGGRTVLFASGESPYADRALFPWNIALDRAHETPQRSAEVRRFAKTVGLEGAKAIPVAGQGANVFQSLIAYRETGLARRTRALEPGQRDVLLDLQEIAKSDRLVLVLDNLHWWDEKSLDLLSDMLSGRLNATFPFLTRTSYVGVVTPEQTAAVPAKFDYVCKNFKGPRVRLDYCSPSAFGAVLMGLGLKVALEPSVTTELYRISGGHLALAEQLVGYLNEKRSADEVLLDPSFEAFCRAIVEERLKVLGPRAEQLRKLLAYAATIGISFTLTELECLAKDSRDRLRECLKDAKTLSLITGEEQRLYFAHELFLRLLGAMDGGSLRDLHDRFAACLNALRPGDYPSRALHLELAGRPFDAAVMRAHAYVIDLRYGRTPSARAYQSEYDGATSVRHFVDTITTMQFAYDAGNYAEAVAAGETIDEALPVSLLAERDLLSARCHIHLLSRRDRERAVTLLSQWSALWETEPEVWARVSLARVVALSYVENMVEAKESVRHIAARLRSRAEYDPDIRRALYRLLLKADMLYAPEAAQQQLRQAVAYFGPVESGAAARDPVNYYIALCNTVGNELYLGNFKEAYSVARHCDVFLRDVQATEGIRLPEPSCLANNLTISGYRSGELSAVEALTLMGHIVEAGTSNDIALIVSNLVGFLLLSGQHTVAVERLRPFYEALSGEADFDAYYRYFIGNNYASCFIALGNLERAREHWHQLTPLVPKIQLPILRYLLRRHELLTRLLDDEELTFEMWENALVDQSPTPVGPGWRHVAHGVLLSDIQFWSDD